MLRYIHYFTFVAVFLVTFGVFNQANADEIEDMSDALNQMVFEQDWKGFGETFAKFVKQDGRYGSEDADKAGESAAKSVVTLGTFGEILSKSPVKVDRCGDRIARTVTVFFAKDGQFFTEYWFFKAGENWSANNINYKGNASSTQFANMLTSALSFTC